MYHNIPEDEDTEAEEQFLTEQERHQSLIDVIMGSSAGKFLLLLSLSLSLSLS